MLNEVFDELSPSRIALGRSGVHLVVEHGRISTGELIWHKSNFYQWLHSQAEDVIKDRVHIEPRIDSIALVIQRIHAHIIIKQAMEANALETGMSIDEE